MSAGSFGSNCFNFLMIVIGSSALVDGTLNLIQYSVSDTDEKEEQAWNSLLGDLGLLVIVLTVYKMLLFRDGQRARIMRADQKSSEQKESGVSQQHPPVQEKDQAVEPRPQKLTARAVLFRQNPPTQNRDQAASQPKLQTLRTRTVRCD